MLKLPGRLRGCYWIFSVAVPVIYEGSDKDVLSNRKGICLAINMDSGNTLVKFPGWSGGHDGLIGSGVTDGTPSHWWVNPERLRLLVRQ